MSEALLSVQDLSVEFTTYGRTERVLKGVSLDVPAHSGALGLFVGGDRNAVALTHLRTITLDPVLQFEIREAVATVLAHEAVHASDTYLYGGIQTNVSCYSYEISAFHLQAVMWQELYGPSGKADADTDLEDELNDIARSVNTKSGRCCFTFRMASSPP